VFVSYYYKITIRLRTKSGVGVCIISQSAMGLQKNVNCVCGSLLKKCNKLNFTARGIGVYGRGFPLPEPLGHNLCL
jgi:hypothetical protein